jgi:PAS domain S-box-containing protein
VNQKPNYKYVAIANRFFVHHILSVLAFLLVVGVMGVFWDSHEQGTRINEELTLAEASHFADSIEHLRIFYSEQIIPLVQSQGVRLPHSHQDTTGIPTPSILIHNIRNILGQNQNKYASYQMRAYSANPFPWNKEGNVRDDFERWALQELTQHPDKAVWRFEADTKGQKILRYASPSRMTASCIACHNSYEGSSKTDWKVGDFAGVLSITRNMAGLESAAERSMEKSFFMSLVLGLGGLVILAFTLRSLQGSLREAQAAVAQADSLAANLRGIQRKTRTIVDSVADALVVINAEGTIIETNPAVNDVFGYTQEELHGQNVALLIHGKHAQPHTSYIQRYLQTGEPNIFGKTLQLHAMRKEGRLIAIEITINEASVDDNVLFTGIVRDITQRIQVKEALAKARDAALESARLKSDFLANMSHEIRTPMNGVIGMSQLLLETSLDSEQRDLAGTVLESGEALLRVINDILDFSRIEAGKFSICQSGFSLLALLEGAVELLAETVSDKGLELAFFIDGDVPDNLISDSVRLRQILLNLIGNAIKFTDHGHVILTVSVAERQDASLLLRFAVQDSGCGINAEDLPKLFMAFSQLDCSSTRKYGGTGLGLAISKQLVNLLGGDVGVESKLGEGSTFWFTVKVTEDAQGEPQPSRMPDGFQMLMLGGDPILNQHYAQQMQVWGITPLMVASLEGLLQALAQGQATNLVLVDTDLPYPQPDYLSGIQAVVSAIREYTTAPIVLYGSNKHIHALRDTCFGQVHLLTKPIRYSLLLRQLERFRYALSVGNTPRPLPAIRVEKAPEPAAIAPVAALSSAERSEVCILLVEDHLVNQKVGLAMLKKLGYGQTDCALNGEEAVRMVQQQDYDIVLMDCQMPVMDGYEATRQIRRLAAAKFKELPIIALTAHAMKGDGEKCFAAGMDDYLTKPVHPEALQKNIDKWLLAKSNLQLAEP